MTLKSHYALCFKTQASFGAYHENLNDLKNNNMRKYSKIILCNNSV